MNRLLNTLAIIVLTAISTASYSQPTLTSANTTPVINDTFHTYFCDTANVTPGPSGAAVTWDYSTLKTTFASFIKYKSCNSSVPGCSLFPSSTIVDSGRLGGYKSLLYGYTHYNVSSSVLSFVGTNDASTNYKIISINSTEILHFPFTYLDNYSDSFKNTADGGAPYETGSINVRADAYGTLILPHDTFNNVLRIERIRNANDGVTSGIYTYTDYLWYLPGTHEPLLTITYFKRQPIADYISGVIISTINPMGSKVGVSKIVQNKIDISISPNPSKGEIKILVSDKAPQQAHCIVTNLMGVKITEDHFQTNSSHSLKINAPAGMYIVKVKLDNGSTSVRSITIN